jgi:hypothetical protein
VLQWIVAADDLEELAASRRARIRRDDMVDRHFLLADPA